MQTKLTHTVWFILRGINIRANMKPEERLNYYRDMKQALLRFGISIKN